MISIETEVTGFDARSWSRLVGLVAPGVIGMAPGSAARAATEPGGLLWVIYGEGRHRAVHSRRGVLSLEGFNGPQDLEQVAPKYGARYAVAAEAGAIEEFYERVGARAHPDDDLFTTALLVLTALQELIEAGRITTSPRLSASVPLPTHEVLLSAWNAFLPDQTCMVVATFEDAALDTAVVVRRRGAALDRVMGAEAVRAMVGPLGGDFQRDFRVIRDAVERTVGPITFGLYTETETLRRLLRAEGAGVWARAIAAREVMVDPMPSWMAMAAGAGALRAAVGRSQALFEAVGLAGLFGPLASTVRLASDVLREVDLGAMLGFDPLELLGLLIRRSASAPRSDDEERQP